MLYPPAAVMAKVWLPPVWTETVPEGEMLPFGLAVAVIVFVELRDRRISLDTAEDLSRAIVVVNDNVISIDGYRAIDGAVLLSPFGPQGRRRR